MKKMDRTYHFKTTAVSTNTELKEQIYGTAAPVFDVLCADMQLGGRGRQGRAFFSPPGGFYFSAAFPLAGNETNVPFLTLLAGLAVSDALLKTCGAQTQIKWPNELYLHGKKLCGILTELVSVGEKMTAVVGVGLNARLQAEEIPPDLRETMTSLSAEGFTPPDRGAFVRTVVETLDEEVYEKGALSVINETYAAKINERSYLKDKSVEVRSGGRLLRGRAAGITPGGALRLLTQDGEVCAVSGEIARVWA